MDVCTKSLRQQVYEYLRVQMNLGRLVPGVFLDLKAISEEIGISRTPLRDALLHLECEGFVTIYPRRGVMVRPLTLERIRNIYEIVGALESATLLSVREEITPAIIDRMHNLNQAMRSALESDDFDAYYESNLNFHNAYLCLSPNEDLLRMVDVLKQQLYDFPRRKGFVKDWEIASSGEHEEFCRRVAAGDFEAAAEYVRNVHWSFSLQEKFVRQYYFAKEAALDQKKGKRLGNAVRPDL